MTTPGERIGSVRLRKNLWVLVSLLILAFAIAFSVHWLMWGYWIERPTLGDSLQVDEILGVSVVDFERDGKARAKPQRADLVRRASLACSSAEANLCLEGRTLVGLKRHSPDLDVAPEVAPSMLDSLSARLRDLDPSPRTGLAVHFRSSSAEELLLAYRTSEVANDRYLFGEILLRVQGSGSLEPIEEIQYYWEFAGLEGVTWELLWIPAFGILLASWLIIHGLKSLTERLRRSSGNV